FGLDTVGCLWCTKASFRLIGISFAVRRRVHSVACVGQCRPSPAVAAANTIIRLKHALEGLVKHPVLVWILVALLASLTPTAQVATVRAEQSSLIVGGITRRFVYEVSSQPAPAGGRPLVIHLHGDGGDMGLSAAWKAAVLNDSNGAVL